MNYICPNNLPLWQSVTKPQQTNEYMREVINHSTHTHLLNTIKSILTQTFEKLCKKRVYGKKTLTTCISETLLNKTHQGIFVWNRNNRLHTSNKKHVFKNRKETTQVEEDKYNVCQHGHKTGIQEEGSKHSP